MFHDIQNGFSFFQLLPYPLGGIENLGKCFSFFQLLPPKLTGPSFSFFQLLPQKLSFGVVPPRVVLVSFSCYKNKEEIPPEHQGFSFFQLLPTWGYAERNMGIVLVSFSCYQRHDPEGVGDRKVLVSFSCYQVARNLLILMKLVLVSFSCYLWPLKRP